MYWEKLPLCLIYLLIYSKHKTFEFGKGVCYVLGKAAMSYLFAYVLSIHLSIQSIKVLNLEGVWYVVGKAAIMSYLFTLTWVGA